MAEDHDDTEKTEEPTQKKLDDAHKKGNVAKSQEVSTWFMMAAATILVAGISNNMLSSLSDLLRVFLFAPHEIAVDGGQLGALFRQVGWGMIVALLAPLGLLMVAAAVGNLVQHRPVFSAESIKPKLSKISPLAGAKRLFSGTSLMNFAKGITKLVVVGAVMFAVAWPERDRLDLMISADVSVILPTIQAVATRLMIGVVIVLTLVAGADYLFQRHKWFEKQRMSHKEIRDEHKQMEGDPAIKAKLRQLRLERGRRRMMANVPDASVVVTNPTHFAVALKYEQGMGAPVCVAKGTDQLALKIREIATQSDVPIVENPALARSLHATVEVDDEVPPDQYRAVAEVIGYVMRMRKKSAWRAT